MKKIKAFTLAEILIVLAIIGAISAVLIPTIFRAKPDENIIKFKKANEALVNSIAELVQSDKYYLEGNLGVRYDGQPLYGNFAESGGTTTTDANIIKYFCTTLASLLATKSVNCSTTQTAGNSTPYTFVQIPAAGELAAWQHTLSDGKTALDTACADKASTVGAEITLVDGTVIYQANPGAAFGVRWGTTPLYESKDGTIGFMPTYKPVCIDVDGIGTGEAPFGYGIRIDGKVLPGTRADAWLEKNEIPKD